MAAFVQAELVPFHADWEKQQRVPREVWRKAGEAGLLCPDVPEEFGGYGADWLYNVVIIEELAKAGMSGPGFMVHSEMVAPNIRTWGSDELKRKWLPRMVTGEAIGAVAMTEPGAGSDLKELRTRAVRDGDHYVINGKKTYISNGQNCDFILLACKTDPAAGARDVGAWRLSSGQYPGCRWPAQRGARLGVRPRRRSGRGSWLVSDLTLNP